MKRYAVRRNGLYYWYDSSKSLSGKWVTEDKCSLYCTYREAQMAGLAALDYESNDFKVVEYEAAEKASSVCDFLCPGVESCFECRHKPQGMP